MHVDRDDTYIGQMTSHVGCEITVPRSDFEAYGCTGVEERTGIEQRTRFGETETGQQFGVQ